MQCKDIPDDEFLDAVDTANKLRNRKSASVWDVQSVLSGYPEHVSEDIVIDSAYPGYLPIKLIRAKARKLIRKYKMNGCMCGCAGWYEILGDSPAERLIRRDNEIKSQNLLELEGVAREWRIRDEKIQDYKEQILGHEAAIKKFKKEIKHLSVYRVVLKSKDGTS